MNEEDREFNDWLKEVAENEKHMEEYAKTANSLIKDPQLVKELSRIVETIIKCGSQMDKAFLRKNKIENVDWKNTDIWAINIIKSLIPYPGESLPLPHFVEVVLYSPHADGLIDYIYSCLPETWEHVFFRVWNYGEELDE